MIDNTWFDRPLSVAGRVLVRNGSKIESKLLYIDKDVLMIPNVAIHLIVKSIMVINIIVKSIMFQCSLVVHLKRVHLIRWLQMN